MEACVQLVVPSLWSGGQCSPCRKYQSPSETFVPLSTLPMLYPLGVHRFSWSRMSVVCASTGLALPASEPIAMVAVLGREVGNSN